MERAGADGARRRVSGAVMLVQEEEAAEKARWEIRNPKVEIRKKPETRSPNRCTSACFLDFGFRGFGLWISAPKALMQLP